MSNRIKIVVGSTSKHKLGAVSGGLCFGVLRRVRDQREDETGTYDMLCKMADGGVLTYVIGQPGILP